MKKIPLTKGKFAIVDDEDYKKVMEYRWKYSNRGYAAKNYVENGKNKTLLMHRLIMGDPVLFVDHIDGDPLNNRKSNLRLATNRQNCLNQKLGSQNTSGYKGISWHKRNAKWAAVVRVNEEGKRVHLGYFDNKHDAARMYNFWASDLYGEFARLNEINEEAI